MHKSISPDELVAIYAISDVCLISSTRDDLNLVSYEYVASQLREERRRGILVMSRYAGASNTLPNGSIVVVNPWDISAFAGAIKTALEMDKGDGMHKHEEVSAVVHDLTR